MTLKINDGRKINLLNLFLLLFLIFFFPKTSIGIEVFTDLECLESTFNIEVIHPASPLGFTRNKLKIEKDKCNIKVSHERLKFIKNYWPIDVCRGPIHFKKGQDALEIIKRDGTCFQKNFHSTAFCQEWNKLKKILQDDGLIFAEGEKENLQSDHGKMYCSYLLLKKYLLEGIIFGRGGKNSDLGLRNDRYPFSEDEIPMEDMENQESLPSNNKSPTGTLKEQGNSSYELSPNSLDEQNNKFKNVTKNQISNLKF
jgi:hypothetical protein